MTSAITPIEKAYSAGFLDGEGCIHISAYKTYKLVVAITNTDYNVLRFFKTKFGGHIHKPRKLENRKQSWQWVTASKSAEEFLKDVYPYLKVKKREAGVALLFREKVKRRGGNHRVTSEDLIFRKRVKKQLEKLKR